jgi:hypothetical protein
MKKLSTIRNIVRLLAILALGTVCQTRLAASGSDNPVKERLLGQTGFRLTTLTTDRQQQQVDTLPHGVVSAVTYHGKLFYVYPTSKRNVVYVGKEQQFNAYKQALSQEYQQETAARASITEETAGPNHVQIQEFDGFGPMNSFGDE